MAHQLINRYFDTSKSYQMNVENDADSWALIVQKVNSVSFCSMFLTFLQMKKCHPHFQWHARNWVLVHITVVHLVVMRCSLKNPDPDLKVLKEYHQLTAKGTIKRWKIRPEPESEPESEVSLHFYLG